MVGVGVRVGVRVRVRVTVRVRLPYHGGKPAAAAAAQGHGGHVDRTDGVLVAEELQEAVRLLAHVVAHVDAVLSKVRQGANVRVADLLLQAGSILGAARPGLL
jgi:hypothetical protein